jgi:ankyrin repeat protein
MKFINTYNKIMTESVFSFPSKFEIEERKLRRPGAIIKAVENNNIRFLVKLINYGVDINIKDKYGYTLLMLAAKYGFEYIANMLIALGADINAESGVDGSTALIWASFGSYNGIVESLLKKGADVNVKNSDGHTALDYVSAEGNPRLFNMFKKYGATKDGE